ncbi:hypothetical protein [Ornithinibacillus sp. FSL M8-0202]|uniref:hypothetical protein n=1 Tax=Ornithinibacillus sp. FSL M8-0202 TaxID=2921616 RepID=UPI0030CF334F
MLLKFAFQDFLNDRRYKNTTKTNIRNYQTLLGEFIYYCIDNEVEMWRTLITVTLSNIFGNAKRKETEREQLTPSL